MGDVCERPLFTSGNSRTEWYLHLYELVTVLIQKLVLVFCQILKAQEMSSNSRKTCLHSTEELVSRRQDSWVLGISGRAGSLP